MFNFFKKKKKKRNEIAIFQELELKPEDFREEIPNKNDLLEINDVYYYYNTAFKKNTYWKLTKPKYTQVNEFRQNLDTDHEDYQLNIPKKSSLKKFKTNIKVNIEEEEENGDSIVTWWDEDENGKLVQVNLSDEGESVKFKMKAWLRKEAINAVKLEINTMKKRAYEYEKEELLQMIEKEEKKIIKKQGWKWVRRLALTSLGIGFIPGL